MVDLNPRPRDRADEEAYALGRQAGRSGLAASLNPFEDGTPTSLEWMRGWTRSVGEKILAIKHGRPEPRP